MFTANSSNSSSQSRPSINLNILMSEDDNKTNEYIIQLTKQDLCAAAEILCRDAKNNKYSWLFVAQKLILIYNEIIKKIIIELNENDIKEKKLKQELGTTMTVLITDDEDEKMKKLLHIANKLKECDIAKKELPSSLKGYQDKLYSAEKLFKALKATKEKMIEELKANYGIYPAHIDAVISEDINQFENYIIRLHLDELLIVKKILDNYNKIYVNILATDKFLKLNTQIIKTIQIKIKLLTEQKTICLDQASEVVLQDKNEEEMKNEILALNKRIVNLDCAITYFSKVVQTFQLASGFLKPELKQDSASQIEKKQIDSVPSENVTNIAASTSTTTTSTPILSVSTATPMDVPSISANSARSTPSNQSEVSTPTDVVSTPKLLASQKPSPSVISIDLTDCDSDSDQKEPRVFYEALKKPSSASVSQKGVKEAGRPEKRRKTVKTVDNSQPLSLAESVGSESHAKKHNSRIINSQPELPKPSDSDDNSFLSTEISSIEDYQEQHKLLAQLPYKPPRRLSSSKPLPSVALEKETNIPTSTTTSIPTVSIPTETSMVAPDTNTYSASATTSGQVEASTPKKLNLSPSLILPMPPKMTPQFFSGFQNTHSSNKDSQAGFQYRHSSNKDSQRGVKRSLDQTTPTIVAEQQAEKRRKTEYGDQPLSLTATTITTSMPANSTFMDLESYEQESSGSVSLVSLPPYRVPQPSNSTFINLESYAQESSGSVSLVSLPSHIVTQPFQPDIIASFIQARTQMLQTISAIVYEEANGKHDTFERMYTAVEDRLANRVGYKGFIDKCADLGLSIQGVNAEGIFSVVDKKTGELLLSIRLIADSEKSFSQKRYEIVLAIHQVRNLYQTSDRRSFKVFFDGLQTLRQLLPMYVKNVSFDPFNEECRINYNLQIITKPGVLIVKDTINDETLLDRSNKILMEKIPYGCELVSTNTAINIPSLHSSDFLEANQTLIQPHQQLPSQQQLPSSFNFYNTEPDPFALPSGMDWTTHNLPPENTSIPYSDFISFDFEGTNLFGDATNDRHSSISTTPTINSANTNSTRIDGEDRTLRDNYNAVGLLSNPTNPNQPEPSDPFDFPFDLDIGLNFL